MQSRLGAIIFLIVSTFAASCVQERATRPAQERGALFDQPVLDNGQLAELQAVSPAPTDPNDNPNAVTKLDPGGLVMPNSDFRACTSVELRREYVAQWVDQQDPELLRRAALFGMPAKPYATLVNDFVCWVLFNYNPAQKHLFERMRHGLFGRLECDVDWNEHCDGSQKLTVPAGWQICRAIYRVSNRRGDTRLILKPGDWTSSNFGKTGFRSYHMTFRADGSGAIFDRVGANLTINDVSLDAISDRLTWQERQARGCDVPEHKPPPPPEPKPQPGAPVSANEVRILNVSSVERYRVWMRNPGKTANRTYYEIYAEDPFWGREMLYKSDVVALGPGDTWDYEFHKYGAIRWRFQHQLIKY